MASATAALRIRGRADDVINTGGEKVVPGEVEAVLGTCDGVADVVVIGLPDAEWGEAVTAFVVAADPGHPPDSTSSGRMCGRLFLRMRHPRDWCLCQNFRYCRPASRTEPPCGESELGEPERGTAAL